MSELRLKFVDPSGEKKLVTVTESKFTVGRHSSCNLCIVDGRLSREHVQIERFGDIYIVTDRGSSNGTKINGARLSEPVALNNGDKLDLGGVEVDVELAAATAASGDAKGVADAASTEIRQTSETSRAKSPMAKPAPAVPVSVFLIAPVLAVMVLILVGGVIYLSGSKGEMRGVSESPAALGSLDDESTPSTRTAADATENIPVVAPTTSVRSGTVSESPLPQPATELSSKIERNAAAFLRAAAQNDQKAFLTSEQAKAVGDKISQLSASPATAANIAAARGAANQLKALAAPINLKPQFVAAAAVARLGTSRGDVVKTAQALAPTLEKLRTQIGSELADDAILMIAALDQGEAGDFMKMRNMLQDLANKFPDSSRSIRNVWFLKQNGKITPAEFDLAVTFLAIGTIAQNPRDFGVNTEAFNF